MIERGFSTQSFTNSTRPRKASEVSEATNLLSQRFSWSETDDLRIDAYRLVEEADTVLPKEIIPRFVTDSTLTPILTAAFNHQDPKH
jgi:hypothetical protein